MNVCLICNNDLNGGAAIVTSRLMQALRHEGLDARMLVFSKLSESPNIEMVSSQNGRIWHFIKERVGIMLCNGFSRKNLFRVSTADTGIDLCSHPWVQEADVILLSWVNQGMLSLKGIRRLCSMGKPVVWVMHDMWCMTGICHHAYECTRYTEQCGCCPYLNSSKKHDLSFRTWRRKKNLYDNTDITFVAVSNWLAECGRRSSLLADQRIEVIPNAFPASSFVTSHQELLNLPQLDYSKKMIVMGASRLDDPIKGLDYAIDALNILFDEHPAIAKDCIAVFYGNLRDKSLFDRLNFPFQLLGSVSDQIVIRELYSAAQIVLSTSLYETLPTTLIEGQAGGALPVTFGRGGQSDIVDHLKTGYIAEYKNPRSVAEGILWALNAGIDRETLHDSVEQRFASRIVVRRFIDLFDELLNGRR